MSYSNRVYLHDYCSMCIYYFINFRSHQFFSLFSVHNNLSSSSCFPQMHTNKSTQKHTHTQTNPHRQTNKEIWVASEERIWVTGAWFVDRPVKKGSGSPSLVRGSAGEERICVARAWFVDRAVKKGPDE